jgi:prolyl 4-hydroxylase
MIQEFQNILSVDECNELIKISKDKLVKALTYGKNEEYRTANITWIDEKTELTNKIKNIVSEKTNLPIKNQEDIHVVKYNIGGEYKVHYDFFRPNTNHLQSEVQNGGQRMYSCLFYINDDFDGGETDFPKVNYRVDPQIGKLVIWKNLNDDLSVNYNSIHAGLPVISGEKWICIVWVRENNFNKNTIKQQKSII